MQGTNYRDLFYKNSYSHLWPALASMTSCFVTLVTHFPIILLITSSTPIGRTSPLSLSSGISRLANIGSIVRRSISSVHNLLVIIAKASHRFVLDFLNDLQARILFFKPLASAPKGPPYPLVLRTAFLHWFVDTIIRGHLRLDQIILNRALLFVLQGVFLGVAS